MQLPLLLDMHFSAGSVIPVCDASRPSACSAMRAGLLWGPVSHADQAAPVQVGTKVYNWEDGKWVVDAEYASRLDQQWSLEAVRDATYAALAAVGKDSMHFRPPDEQNDHKVVPAEAVSNLCGGVQAVGVHRLCGAQAVWCTGCVGARTQGLAHKLRWRLHECTEQVVHWLKVLRSAIGVQSASWSLCVRVSKALVPLLNLL